MHIEIQARGFTLTQAIRGYVERRLRFALSARYARIDRLRVRLSDINGPRGGRDKRCHLQVLLPGQTALVIEDTKANLYVAIDCAADRARRTLTRRLARQRDNDRALALDNRQLASNHDYFQDAS